MIFSTLQNAVVTNALKKFTSIGQRSAPPAAPALTVNYSHQIQITIIISHALHVGKNVFLMNFVIFYSSKMIQNQIPAVQKYRYEIDLTDT